MPKCIITLDKEKVKLHGDCIMFFSFSQTPFPLVRPNWSTHIQPSES